MINFKDSCYIILPNDEWNIQTFIITNIEDNEKYYINTVETRAHLENILSNAGDVLDKFTFKNIDKCFYKIPRNISVMYYDTKLMPSNIFLKYFLTKQIILPELSNIIFNDLLESIRLDINRYPLIIL